MTGLLIFLFLFLLASCPLLGVLLWFKALRLPLKLLDYLFALIAGALAFLLAGLIQSFFPPLWEGNQGVMRIRLFIQIALTEEGAKFLTLLVVIGMIKRSFKPSAIAYSPGYVFKDRPPDLTALGTALGLLVGLSFALIENASYGSSDFNAAIVRAVTTAPLHGACGSRAGAAAVNLPEKPMAAALRFLHAVLIHGLYNLLLTLPGLPAFLALFILPFSVLVSSLLVIHRGLNRP